MRWKVGDKVRVKPDVICWGGVVSEVVDIRPPYSEHAREMSIGLGIWGGTIYFSEDELELPTEGKWEVGDCVRIKVGMYTGQVGKVVDVTEDSYFPVVVDIGNKRYYVACRSGELEGVD